MFQYKIHVFKVVNHLHSCHSSQTVCEILFIPSTAGVIADPQLISDVHVSAAETNHPTVTVQSDMVNYSYRKGPKHGIMVACNNKSCLCGMQLVLLGVFKAPPPPLPKVVLP